MTVDIKTVLTNTTLMGAYRGAGRPEANYYLERLIDRAADEMGINRVTLRKRNFIKPAQMPFKASSGVTYDSGDFQGVLTKALEMSDHANFAKRKKESKKNGKLRGIAVGSYLEVTAPPSGELGKITFEPDGSVKLTTGTLDYGQGHATPFAQVLSAQLGVPFEKITLEQNDSDLVRFGNGTGGSRSITATGQAIVEASALVIAKGKQAAAHLMEASEGDIEFAKGRFTIAGTDRSIGIMEPAQRDLGLGPARGEKPGSRWKSATIPRQQSPIRWAPKAAARPAAPEASSASSTRWSTRCRSMGSPISTCR